MPSGLSIRLLQPLLRLAPLRRRIALAMRTGHFHELDFSLPLTHGLSAPVAREADRVSFSEIFLENVYGDLLRAGPLPARWLDLGCHAGYFSLWLEWQRRRSGLPAGNSAALLVDADPRGLEGLNRLVALNRLGTPWPIMHGAIAAGSGNITFFERGFMGSSTSVDGGEIGQAVTVPILTPESLQSKFPPPYDLIKLDVEGAEKEFFAHYGHVWHAAKMILLEWHQPQLGPGGVDAIVTQLRSAGFSRVQDFGPPVADGSHGHLLAIRETGAH